MSVVREAIEAIKDTLLLSDKVERIGTDLKDLAETLANHEKRLIRMETRWDTAIQLTANRRDS